MISGKFIARAIESRRDEFPHTNELLAYLHELPAGTKLTSSQMPVQKLLVALRRRLRRGAPGVIGLKELVAAAEELKSDEVRVVADSSHGTAINVVLAENVVVGFVIGADKGFVAPASGGGSLIS